MVHATTVFQHLGYGLLYWTESDAARLVKAFHNGAVLSEDADTSSVVVNMYMFILLCKYTSIVVTERTCIASNNKVAILDVQNI